MKKHPSWWWRTLKHSTVSDKGRIDPKDKAPKHPRHLPIAPSKRAVEGQLFKDQERAAHVYECVRRYYPKQKLDPWPDLAWETKAELCNALGKPRPIVWRASIDDFKVGWSRSVEFNLRLSDSVLLDGFKLFLRSQRDEQPNMRKRAKQPAKNPPSWRWIELWDQHEAGKPLNNSEHGSVAKAKDRADQHGPDVLRVLNRVRS